MIVLGIDPGSRFTGIGIVHLSEKKIIHRAHGVLSLSSKLSMAEKLNSLHTQLDEVFVKYKPNHVVLEKIFVGKNVDSAFKLGQVRGICLQLMAKNKSEVFEYAAKSIKKIITGSGAASKESVGAVVGQLLKTQLEAPWDSSDALALAIGHCQKWNEQIMIRKNYEVNL